MLQLFFVQRSSQIAPLVVHMLRVSTRAFGEARGATAAVHKQQKYDKQKFREHLRKGSQKKQGIVVVGRWVGVGIFRVCTINSCCK